jgi:MFS family permease
MTGRELLRLVLAQVSVHSAMTGCRLASPLLALQQGRSAAEVGVLLALFALSSVVLALPSGRLADRRGLHLPLALSVGSAMLGAALSALWPVFGMLCVTALLTGAAAGTAQIALQHYVGRAAADAQQLRTVFSWIAIAPAAANFLGPLAAGLLIDHAWPEHEGDLNFRVTYGVLALLPLACWLLARRAPALPPAHEGQNRPGDSVWDLLGLLRMRRLLFVNWLQAMAWDAHSFALPLIGHERALSASVIGTLMGSFALAAALVRVALPKLTARVPEWRVMLVSSLTATVALLLYPLTLGAWTMGMCSVVLGFALGAVQPMVVSLLHQDAPPGRQGEAMALRVMTINISSTLMPMLFGSVGAVVGMSGVFWIVASVLGLGSRTVVRLRPEEAQG